MKKIAALTLALALITTSCANSSESSNQEDTSDKVVITTTLFPLYEFAKAVGGVQVEVNLLLDPGMEPHSFNPSIRDVSKISQSDIFLMIGEEMEPWAQKTLESIKGDDLVVIEAMDLVPVLLESDHEHDDEHDDEHTGLDPHIWLDLENAQVIVEAIASKLAETDEENSSFYQSNQESYLIKLQALDNSFEQKLANCEQSTVISGGHNAFSYLANRYGFTIFSSHDLAPDSEPSPRRIEELFNLARENEINYVIFEELVSPRLAEIIAEEVGAETLVVNPGGNIAKNRFEAGVSYIDLMEENRDNLAIALECR